MINDDRMVNLIKAIRHRLEAGISRDVIAMDFGRFYTQEEIFLAYHAAKILMKD